ncbi:MAG: hypothetical protein HUJ56_02795, partial [Erysipelotrichaceae bacterium]|nr:hypothetical protein [Erysipelotrichaceae bacterium]
RKKMTIKELEVQLEEKQNELVSLKDAVEAGDVEAITKAGYVPLIYIIKSGKIYIQDMNIEGVGYIDLREIYVGNNVTTKKGTGDVYFKDSNINLNATKVILCPGSHIELGSKVQINKNE